MNSTLQNAHGRRQRSNMEVTKIICFLVTQNHFNLKSYILNNTNSSHFKSSLTPTSLASTHKSPLCSSSRPSSSNLNIPLIIYSPSSSVHCPNHLRHARPLWLYLPNIQHDLSFWCPHSWSPGLVTPKEQLKLFISAWLRLGLLSPPLSLMTSLLTRSAFNSLHVYLSIYRPA